MGLYRTGRSSAPDHLLGALGDLLCRGDLFSGRIIDIRLDTVHLPVLQERHRSVQAGLALRLRLSQTEQPREEKRKLGNVGSRDGDRQIGENDQLYDWRHDFLKGNVAYAHTKI